MNQINLDDATKLPQWLEWNPDQLRKVHFALLAQKEKSLP